MASLAIRAIGPVMHVSMAVNTFALRLGEDQAFMALPAFKDLVLTGQGHSGLVVVESIDRFIEFPAVRTMTKITAQFKIFAVR